MDINDFRVRWLEVYVKQFFPAFEFRAVALIVLATLFILVNIGFIIYFIKFRKSGETVGSDVTYKWYKKVGIWLWNRKAIIVLIIFDLLLVLLLWVLFFMTFIIRPNVISSLPAQDGYMLSAEQQIFIEFDMPIDQESVKFNMSPEVDGRWEWDTIWGKDALKRKVTFIPKESIYPGSVVVIYVTGIKQPWSDGKQHEVPIEFYGPKIPAISKVVPDSGSDNVPINKPLYIEYDSSLGSFAEIKYELTPEVQYELTQSGDFAHILKLGEELAQDTQYSLKAYRTLRSYEVASGEDIDQSDTEVILDISFKTVTTPYLNDYSPKGAAAPADVDIIAQFDQGMNKKEVEENFSIDPAVEGKIEWQDNNTFVFNPDEELVKGQSYTVKFNKGLNSGMDGKTKEDIIFTFGVAGKVTVSSISPISGSIGLEPTGRVIEVQFNQPVDHESAQSKFSLTPAAPGVFSWEGDLMRYTLSGPLAFSTRYTITVSPGVRTVYGIDSDQAFSSVFTTRDNSFRISGIPYYRQQEGFTCNIAATRMVLGYYGVNLSENQIRNGIGITDNPNTGWVAGYGVHVAPVSGFVDDYRTVEVRTGWNVTELLQTVQGGDPVILWWYNRYSQPAGAYTLPSGETAYMGMHSEIVYGFAGTPENPTAIYVMDPWRGYLTYTPATFTSNWAYLNRTALVVR